MTVCAPSRPDSQDVNYLLFRPPIEDDAPLADAQSPKAFGSAEAFDVAVGESADRRADAIAVFPAQLTE